MPGHTPTVEDTGRSRIAQRIKAQLSALQDLAPDIDWSRALPPTTGSEPPAPHDGASGAVDAGPSEELSVSEVERPIDDQVAPVSVRNEVAEVSRRTHALER